MLKIELDYQVEKAIEYMDRGGNFERWLESKEFAQEEIDYIKKHPKIIKKQTEKV